MARRARLEDTLAALQRLGTEPHGSGTEVALRDALRSKIGVVVAAAAAIVGEHRLEALGGERAAAAALALGESRLEAAVAPLVAWCDAPGADVRVGFLALALVRHEAATRHLLEVVARDPQVARARAAIDALATFKDDRAL